jgi:hypothetical protein
MKVNGKPVHLLMKGTWAHDEIRGNKQHKSGFCRGKQAKVTDLFIRSVAL